MPLLACATRSVGRDLGSRAIKADATQTNLCVWPSAIVPSGLVLNAAFGWWWGDPSPVSGSSYVAASEGSEHWKAEEIDDCC